MLALRYLMVTIWKQGRSGAVISTSTRRSPHRQDSNLQPDRYERRNFDHLHFHSDLIVFVAFRSRRFWCESRAVRQ
jgi:hypothetical protein